MNFKIFNHIKTLECSYVLPQSLVTAHSYNKKRYLRIKQIILHKKIVHKLPAQPHLLSDRINKT